ncbi:MAG: DUF799 family lipoprotein [Deltaproteobacteria bacterium]|nr:DUF799 family lipoprotein [Deltaproteobacteria bacterium]
MIKAFSLMWIVFLLAGCGFRATHVIVPDYVKKTIRLVVLMPVDDQANDKIAARMLREKMLEELYYKGYPKIPLDLIDAQLRKLGQGNRTGEGSISPQAVGDLLKVDAVMYCTLSKSGASLHFLYAPTSISAICELKSAKTGEILWRASFGVVERNFGYSRYDVERKAVQVYEAAIQKVVNKFMETLPDGPDLS